MTIRRLDIITLRSLSADLQSLSGRLSRATQEQTTAEISEMRLDYLSTVLRDTESTVRRYRDILLEVSGVSPIGTELTEIVDQSER